MTAKKKPTLNVMGVKIDITLEEVAEHLSDWDVVEGVAISQDESSTESEKMIASVRIMKRVFADKYDQVKRELRAANDGVLTAETMAQFMTETFKALVPNS